MGLWTIVKHEWSEKIAGRCLYFPPERATKSWQKLKGGSMCNWSGPLCLV